MKKLFKVALVAGCILFAGNFAKAQTTKIGHINFNQLVDLMPESKAVNTQLQAYQKQFVDQLTTMNNEYNTKVQAFQAQNATMTDAVRTAKANEIQDIQKRMQDYNNTAQQQVSAKSQELSKPIIDKARAAVGQVAKEKGYTYVIDTYTTDLIVSPEADDLLAAAKAKLGLK
jgi:outer membrane protein